MDGVSSRARPTKLFVYIDETLKEFDGRHVLGAALIRYVSPYPVVT